MPAPGTKATKSAKTKEAKAKKVGALDTAAQVLAGSREPTQKKSSTSNQPA